MKTIEIIFGLLFILLGGSVAIGAFVLAARRIIAYLKGDESTLNRLLPYSECEELALKYYGVDSKLFSQYWSEVKKQKGISAVPYDALELAEWEYDIINNK